MAAVFVPNVVGIHEALTLYIKPVIRMVMNEVVDVAMDIAPVRTGTWRDSFRTRERMAFGFPAGQVFSIDPAGRFKEFGTSDTPTWATLRRAAESVRF